MAKYLPLLSVTATTLFLPGCGGNLKPLQDVVDSTHQYAFVNPPRTNLFPGGLAVADNKTTTFYGLPTAAGVSKPSTAPFTAVWPKEAISGSFSIQAVVSGLEKAIGGGVGVNHNSQLTLEQINAPAQQLTNPDDAQNIASNPIVAKQIQTWKKENYAVYIVTDVVTATNISVTSSGNLGIDTAFNKPLTNCGGAGGGGAAGGGGGGGAGSGGAAGSLQICKNSDSQITLNSNTPVIFAAGLREILLDGNGNPQVQPIAVQPHGGELGRAPDVRRAFGGVIPTTGNVGKNKRWPK